jgi:hypothetical protein
MMSEIRTGQDYLEHLNARARAQQAQQRTPAETQQVRQTATINATDHVEEQTIRQRPVLRP